MASITELEDKVNKLKPEDRKLFEDIFDVCSFTGKLKIPAAFRAKVTQYFCERNENKEITESEEEVVRRLETQKVIRTFNKWTKEGALFNQLRASRPGTRPVEIEEEKKKINEHIEKAMGNCDFCEPRKYTPEDMFGRVEGRHCITAANIAKYDAWSSIVIFKRHNPLEFGQEELSDYIEAGFEWFNRVYEKEPGFEYPFFMWNCLEKAGASRVHGHAQVLIGRGMYYAKVEVLRKAAEKYRKEKGREYFDDLFAVHDSSGLALSDGEVKILAYLSPVKEKEIMIITPGRPSESDKVKAVIFETLRCFIDKLGVTSFNLTISMPGFGADNDFPYVVRIVDRGSIFKTTADIGGMELYGSSVISADPYRVIEALGEFYSK